MLTINHFLNVWTDAMAAAVYRRWGTSSTSQTLRNAVVFRNINFGRWGKSQTLRKIFSRWGTLVWECQDVEERRTNIYRTFRNKKILNWKFSSFIHAIFHQFSIWSSTFKNKTGKYVYVILFVCCPKIVIKKLQQCVPSDCLIVSLRHYALSFNSNVTGD